MQRISCYKTLLFYCQIFCCRPTLGMYQFSKLFMCIYSIIMLYWEHFELVRVVVKITHHLYVTANASNAC